MGRVGDALGVIVVVGLRLGVVVVVTEGGGVWTAVGAMVREIVGVSPLGVGVGVQVGVLEGLGVEVGVGAGWQQRLIPSESGVQSPAHDRAHLSRSG